MLNSYSIETLLTQVQKPARYIGGETNAVCKNPGRCRVSFALAFPDVYEIGMSHPGIQILYSILNRQPDVAAERCYAPWPDMETLMHAQGIPLFTLESKTPLHRFDIVGFSLQYELSYTNVLAMLNLGKIPLRQKDRRDGDPIVIAGGPCVFNPEPMVLFFDAFAIGEGEDVVIEIARAVAEGKEKKRSRNAILESLSELEGVYVPSVFRGSAKIRKRVVADLNQSTLPEQPIVPLIKTVHDRITLEIARGCTRGCRFCQAGMVWRPVRERTPQGLLDNAAQVLASTGYDEISLLSLSAGDYSCIEYLIGSLMNRYYEKRIALALPSLRTETLTPQLIDQIKRVRKTSFTLAPEAGTQRLRNVINKGNTEDNLLATARRVYEGGWKSIKLYFMIGLPTERREDLEGIADLACKVLKEGNNRRQVTVSLSTFIPKPHTPFQWMRQIGIEEIRERQAFFRDRIRQRNLKLKWHDRRMSFLEGLISRGDRKIGELVEKVFLQGCRFDGWSDHFDFARWEAAIEDLGIHPDTYLGERHSAAPLPWDHIDCRIDKNFLLEELEKSSRESLTEDCRLAACTRCGACTEGIRVITADCPSSPDVGSAPSPLSADTSSHSVMSLRIAYTKKGNSRFLSHLDTSAALIRAITRSGFRFIFSGGFHPYPKISFPGATPLGMESLSEYADIQVHRENMDMTHMKKRLSSALPSGMEILHLTELAPDRQSLSKEITGVLYQISFDEADRERVFTGLHVRIERFLSAGTATITRTIKGKEKVKDIRPLVDSITCDEDTLTIDMTLRLNEKGGVRPLELLISVLKVDEKSAERARIIKKETLFIQEAH